MGMFDRLYDSSGSEWQTKAYWCELRNFRIGDQMPFIDGTKELDDYQVAVLGEVPGDPYADRLATVRAGVLVAVPDERDPSLPRLDYFGNVRESAAIARAKIEGGQS